MGCMKQDVFLVIPQATTKSRDNALDRILSRQCKLKYLILLEIGHETKANSL